MIVLADNDILLKLASCDLFGELLAAFGVSYSDIRVLPTARFALTREKKRKQVGDAAFGRLRTFLDQVRDIDVAPDPEEIAVLAEQPRIDPGEAVLFSVCPKIQDCEIFTGDKRSLTSLAEASVADVTCKNLSDRLSGKVVCFEQILLRVLDHSGFDAISSKLIAGRDCDKTLAIVLGSGLDATESVLREGLSSYIADLRRSTGVLLVPATND